MPPSPKDVETRTSVSDQGREWFAEAREQSRQDKILARRFTPQNERRAGIIKESMSAILSFCFALVVFNLDQWWAVWVAGINLTMGLWSLYALGSILKRRND